MNLKLIIANVIIEFYCDVLQFQTYILVELDALWVKQDIVFDEIVPIKFDNPISNISEDSFELFTNSGSGSGGYAHHIFCHAAQELFNIKVDKVEFKPLRFVLINKLINK